MEETEVPPKEKERLDALRSYGILDTDHEKELDDITQLAASISNSPIALISLIDQDRQWFKSHYGLSIDETARNISFCHYTIQHNSIFEVNDTREDKRFASNPLVTGEPNIRFYAGAPLTNEDGYHLGTLCVVDTVPKSLTSQQKNALTILARQVINNFELNRKRRLLEQEKQNLEAIIQQRTSQLTEAVHKLEQVLNVVPHPIFLKDNQGRYTLANKAQCDLFNVTREEFIGKDDSFFVKTSDEILNIRQTDLAVTEQNEVVFIPGQIITNSKGVTKTLNTTKIPFKSTQGEETGILGVSVDISAQKEVEEKLRQSEERYRNLVENSPDAILIQSNGIINYINKSGTKLFGVSRPQDLQGKPIIDYAPENIREKIRERILQIQEGHPFASMFIEQKLLRANGELIDVEVMGVPFTYQGERAIHLIIRDIRERKNFIDEIYRKEKEFKALTENSQDIITRLDRNYRHTYINRAVTRETGRSPEEYLNKTPREMGFPNDLSDSIKKMLEEVFSTGKTISTSYERPHSNGSVYLKYLTGVPERDQDGNIVSVLITIRDITDLKRTEQELREINNELNTFIYRAFHDLKGPLATIKGLGILGNMQYPVAKDMFDMIIHTSDRFEHTLKNLKSLSRVKQENLNVSTLSVKEIITWLTKETEGLSKDCSPIVRTGTSGRLSFNTDSEILYIILRNLLSNAITFCRKDITPEIRVALKNSESGLQIEIEDNGEGIREEIKDRIFDMYYRGSMMSEGAGMGLFLVKKAVKKLQGSVEYQTRTGHDHGTLFKVFLPDLK